MGKRALSWVMRRKGYDDQVLCYDHARIPEIAESWKRAGRADTDACELCADFCGASPGNGHVTDDQRFWPRGTETQGTLDLMVKNGVEKLALIWQDFGEHARRVLTLANLAAAKRAPGIAKPLWMVPGSWPSLIDRSAPDMFKDVIYLAEEVVAQCKRSKPGRSAAATDASSPATGSRRGCRRSSSTRTGTSSRS